MLNKDMTFFEAVAAMDAGYVVEREHGDGWRWRKSPMGSFYECVDMMRRRDEWSDWGGGDVRYSDIHATDWRIVEEMAVDEEQDADGERDVTAMLRLLEAGHVIERAAKGNASDVVQYRQVDQHYVMRYRSDDEGWSNWAETGLFYDDLHATNWRLFVRQEQSNTLPTAEEAIHVIQEAIKHPMIKDTESAEVQFRLKSRWPAMFRPEESS